jgi:hypothetical protein
MTSTGRLLSGTVKDKNSLAAGLQDVLTEYAKLPEKERKAASVEGEEKPVPAPPEGGLVLTVYDRPLGRSDEGKYHLPEGRDMDGFRTHAPHGQRSSLWLTAEECRSLIPDDPKKGETHKVPAKLTKRICLMGLWPQTLWVVEQVWQSDSLREAELNLDVVEVTEKAIRLKVHGSALLAGTGPLKQYPTGKVLKTLENRYDATIAGVLEFDRTAKKFTRWDMAILGDYIGVWFAGNDGWKEATAGSPIPLGFAFEIDQTAYQLPPERRRPKSFVHAYIFKEREQYYWDPEKWEAAEKKK